MGWTAPKIDWGATDAVPHTSLNDIGNNLQYCHDLFEISSMCDKALVPTVGGFIANQTVYVAVPDGYTLTLLRRRWYLVQYGIGGHDELLLTVKSQIVGGAVQETVTSTTNFGDDSPAVELYANTSGSTVGILVIVGVTNDYSATLVPSGGWSLGLAVAES